jgi:hypothetical protein
MRRPLAAFCRPWLLPSVISMEITAAGTHSPGLAGHIVAYVLFAYLVFAVITVIASIFSRRWRRIAIVIAAIIWLLRHRHTRTAEVDCVIDSARAGQSRNRPVGI